MYLLSTVYKYFLFLQPYLLSYLLVRSAKISTVTPMKQLLLPSRSSFSPSRQHLLFPIYFRKLISYSLSWQPQIFACKLIGYIFFRFPGSAATMLNVFIAFQLSQYKCKNNSCRSNSYNI